MVTILFIGLYEEGDAQLSDRFSKKPSLQRIE